MSEYVYGNKIGRDTNIHYGTGNITTTSSEGVSRAQLDEAISELRSFVAELTARGVVADDGSVRDPAAVLAATRAQPGRFTALTQAVAGGAKDAVLSVVRGGVAALVVALVGGL